MYRVLYFSAVHDVDMDNKTYKLHTKKTGNKLPKTTLHSMRDELYKVFVRSSENRSLELNYGFWHRYWSIKKNPYVGNRYMGLNKFTQRLCKKANANHFSLHQLRHLAATLLKESGASLSQMQLFLRHDEQKTTEIYAGHLDNSTAKQSEYLGNFWSQKVTACNETV